MDVMMAAAFQAAAQAARQRRDVRARAMAAPDLPWLRRAMSLLSEKRRFLRVARRAGGEDRPQKGWS